MSVEHRHGLMQLLAAASALVAFICSQSLLSDNLKNHVQEPPKYYQVPQSLNLAKPFPLSHVLGAGIIREYIFLMPSMCFGLLRACQ